MSQTGEVLHSVSLLSKSLSKALSKDLSTSTLQVLLADLYAIAQEGLICNNKMRKRARAAVRVINFNFNKRII